MGYVLRLAFWAAVLFTLVMALLPQPPTPVSNDKMLHMLTFGVLAALAGVSYRATSLARLLVGLSVFGALIEVLQAIPQLHRDSDPLDWVADTLAVALILSIYWLARTMPPGQPLKKG